MAETISALRELNEHPDTVFTVLTGTGRFFSAGADIKGIVLEAYICRRILLSQICSTAMGSQNHREYANPAEKKLAMLQKFGPGKNLSLLLVSSRI